MADSKPDTHPAKLQEKIQELSAEIYRLKAELDQSRASEEFRYRLAAIVESSDDAIVSKTLDGIITSWNKGAERIFGYTAAEVINKSILIVIPKDRHNEEPQILDRIRRGERVEHYQTVRQRKNGEWIDVSLTVSPVRDKDGKIIGVSKIARDITALKKAEKQLVEDKKRLERINLELDSFVYIASHDLRSPVRAIASFAGMIEQESGKALSPTSADFLNEIKLGAKRMSSLIQDLLTLSRVSRINNPYETVNLSDILQTVRDRLVHDFKLTGAVIKENFAGISFKCDRIKMTEVFVNLVSNAIKFSTKNQKNPEIEIGAKKADGQYAFYVKDNGIGISFENHEQIFEMFKRLHRASEYEGTGTGLYIVKKIIEEHGGTIRVESELGKGTTIHFSIPEIAPDRAQEENHAVQR